jgi:hypothetical protein
MPPEMKGPTRTEGGHMNPLIQAILVEDIIRRRHVEAEDERRAALARRTSRELRDGGPDLAAGPSVRFGVVRRLVARRAGP